MKKIIQLFKEFNKTKKIVIIYITISFVFIFGISLYNTLKKPIEQNKIDHLSETDKVNQNSKNEKTETQLQKDETDVNDENKEIEEKKSKNNRADVNNNQSKSNQIEKKDSNDTNDNETNKNGLNETNINQPENTGTSIPVKDRISISIQVTGINNVIMQGNVTIDKGESAYTALKTLANQNGVKISTTGFGKMVYVRGIGDLFEKQHGSLSGWMYTVNDISTNYGAGSYTLEDGDYLLWYYANYE